MRDEERGEIEDSFAESIDAPRYSGFCQDIFGDFSVVVSGVEIMLNGRSISSHKS